MHISILSTACIIAMNMPSVIAGGCSDTEKLVRNVDLSLGSPNNLERVPDKFNVRQEDPEIGEDPKVLFLYQEWGTVQGYNPKSPSVPSLQDVYKDAGPSLDLRTCLIYENSEFHWKKDGGEWSHDVCSGCKYDQSNHALECECEGVTTKIDLFNDKSPIVMKYLGKLPLELACVWDECAPVTKA